MRKLSFLIALCTLLTVGGVYATWTYMETNNVADSKMHMAVNLTDAEFTGSYGTYKVESQNLVLSIDPKEGTSHITALYGEGAIVITFTPSFNAPQDVKDNGVASTFQFALKGDWKYEGQDMIAIKEGHTDPHAFTWTDRQVDENGVITFTYVIQASELLAHFEMAEILLDTHAKYLAYDEILGNCGIDLIVSDGITTENENNGQ